MTTQPLGPDPGIAFQPGNEQAGAVWITELIRIVGGIRTMPAQADSTAATVADLRTDFNALLAALKTAGLMET